MASPVLSLIERLLQRGVASGDIRPGIDALTSYVAMMSLAYYGKSHAHMLSRILALTFGPAPGSGSRQSRRGGC